MTTASMLLPIARAKLLRKPCRYSWVSVFACALSVFGSLAAADESADRAVAFLMKCANRFPESRTLVAELKSDGWQYLGPYDQFQLYTSKADRVIAATATTSSENQGCFAAVRKLTPDGAVLIAEQIARTLRFKAITVDDLASVKSILPVTLAAWAGKLNGFEVILVAVAPQDFHVLRGASILISTP